MKQRSKPQNTCVREDLSSERSGFLGQFRQRDGDKVLPAIPRGFKCRREISRVLRSPALFAPELRCFLQ